MTQIKCEECGQMFSENEASCPNCDCPNDKEIRSNAENHLAKEVATAGNGCEYEKAVKNYAHIAFIVTVVGGFLLYMLILVEAIVLIGDVWAFLIAFWGAIFLIACIYWSYIIKALLMIYVNMSANLHEINKKLQ